MAPLQRKAKAKTAAAASPPPPPPPKDDSPGVMVTFLPAGTTPQAVKKVLKCRKVIFIRTGWSWGYGKAYFTTRAEAEAAAARTDVVIGGNHIGLHLLGKVEPPEQWAKRQAEQAELTFLIVGLPTEATESDVQSIFPNALRVVFQYTKGTPTGRARVAFRTKPEAEAALARKTVEVRGVSCSLLRSVGELGTAHIVTVLSDRPEVQRDALRAAFPAAKVVRAIDRTMGKSFELTFATKEEVDVAVRHATVEVDGQTLRVIRGAYPEKDEVARIVILRGSDVKAKEEDILAAFPGAAAARVCGPPDAAAWRRAFVRFPTAAQAAAVAAQGTALLGENTVRIQQSMTREEFRAQHEAQRKRQREDGAEGERQEKPAKRPRPEAQAKEAEKTGLGAESAAPTASQPSKAPLASKPGADKAKQIGLKKKKVWTKKAKVEVKGE